MNRSTTSIKTVCICDMEILESKKFRNKTLVQFFDRTNADSKNANPVFKTVSNNMYN